MRSLSVFPAASFDDDQMTIVIAPQLLVCVQQLDAVNGAVRRDVHVERVAQLDRLHLGPFSHGSADTRYCAADRRLASFESKGPGQ